MAQVNFSIAVVQMQGGANMVQLIIATTDDSVTFTTTIDGKSAEQIGKVLQSKGIEARSNILLPDYNPTQVKPS